MQFFSKEDFFFSLSFTHGNKNPRKKKKITCESCEMFSHSEKDHEKKSL